MIVSSDYGDLDVAAQKYTGTVVSLAIQRRYK
jgi:hypothetical protein